MQDKRRVKKERLCKDRCCSEYQDQQILALKVTDEKVHDNKALPGLFDEFIKSDNMVTAATIGKLFADGAYEGNDIFRFGEHGIQQYVKVRKNARIIWKK